MRSFWSAPIALLIAVLALSAAACEENTIGPGTNVNQSLKATINGTEYSFPITEIFSTYTDALNTARFSGTILTSPARTLQVTATTDIDNDSYPKELHDPDVSFTYQVSNPGDTTFYQCKILGDDCHLTVTSATDGVIRGTFHATLTNPSDTTDRVTITNGSFVVKLQRQ